MGDDVKHTPGPWSVGDLDHNGQRIVRSEHIEICTCWHHCVESIEREMEANAASIVLAVNAHDDLVAACRAALNYIDAFGRDNDSAPTIDQLEAALAKAQP